MGAGDVRLVVPQTGEGQGVKRLTGRPGITGHVLRLAPSPVDILAIANVLDQRLHFDFRPVEPPAKDKAHRYRLRIVVSLGFLKPGNSSVACDLRARVS